MLPEVRFDGHKYERKFRSITFNESVLARNVKQYLSVLLHYKTPNNHHRKYPAILFTDWIYSRKDVNICDMTDRMPYYDVKPLVVENKISQHKLC